jgi:sulfur-carrier protein
MTVTVCYFGLLAERRGLAQERITTTVGTARDLYQHLAAEHPLQLATRDLRVAVNDVFVTWEHALVEGDTVAFLPPMSGG